MYSIPTLATILISSYLMFKPPHHRRLNAEEVNIGDNSTFSPDKG